MHQKTPKVNLLAMKYWPAWLMVSIFWLISKLPLPVILSIGKFCGPLLSYIVPKRREVSAINIKKCYPELSNIEQEQLVDKAFDSLGIAITEIMITWFWSDRRFKKIIKQCDFVNLHLFFEAMKCEKGIIIFGPHILCMELAGRVLANYLPIYPVYRQLEHPVYNYVMMKARKRIYPDILHHRKLRKIIQTLNDNNIVWMPVDHDHGKLNSVFVPFFNILTAATTTLPRLAKRTDATLLCANFKRKENKKGYVLSLLPISSDIPSDDIVADTAAITQAIETVIRRIPEQYMWQHRRFKTRPDSEADFYADVDVREKKRG